MSEPQLSPLRLGQALRGLRTARGLTIQELALRMGKRRSSWRTISLWELGHVWPRSDQLVAFLEALDMTFLDLHNELNPVPTTSPRLQEMDRMLERIRRRD